MNKKIVLIVVAILIVIGIVLGLNFYNNRKQTIEQITGVNLDDIAYIEYSSGKEIDVSEFVAEYKNTFFQKCNKYHQSTVADLDIVCYDKNNNVILTIKSGNHYEMVAGEYDSNNPPKYGYNKVD